ncbi:MAG: hypothetical protein KKF44_06550 [Nanoarchaeota archaeon]|nr:hypothetical protein [Nanoarchaeota archaeon]
MAIDYSLIRQKPKYYFHLRDGQIIKNQSELEIMLDRISAEVFNFHVTAAKNDFSVWIDSVFHDGKLAEKIRYAKTKEEMINIIKKLIDNAGKTEKKEENKITKLEKQSQEPGSPDLDEIDRDIEETNKELSAEEKDLETQKQTKKDSQDFFDKIKSIKNSIVLGSDSISEVEKNIPIENRKFLVKGFKVSLDEHKKKVSDLRKKGHDTKICELHVMGMISKIMIFEATGNQKDLNEIVHAFYHLQEEMEELKIKRLEDEYSDLTAMENEQSTPNT